MIFDEEEGGMIFLLSQRQQKGKVLNTCYWRIYNIMTMAMMMILLHKSCKVFYLLMIMIFIDIIPNIFSCATKINFARLSLLCWLDSWPMHHEAAQLSSCVDCSCCIAVGWGGRCSPVSKSVAAFKLNSNLGIERVFKDKDDRWQIETKLEKGPTELTGRKTNWHAQNRREIQNNENHC